MRLHHQAALLEPGGIGVSAVHAQKLGVWRLLPGVARLGCWKLQVSAGAAPPPAQRGGA